ncbi:ABC transporter permease [Kitasatospora herbaricolor]|uniref:ABC transporter permease n=1 Tax=Kitasatospora herbaricolor TaxID=68217 RepID=A0ABZ1W854_9ACTN|nr:ABC transporter permease [Kitasatospora herbaricolor]
MFRFLVRRMLGAGAILLIISAITFCLFYAVPADPARSFCGKICSPTDLETVRTNLGMNEALPMQYWHWFVALFVGRTYPAWGDCAAPCLGYSFTNHEPVLATILDRFPTTISLTLGAAVVFLVLGVGAGMLAAHKQGSLLDKSASAISLTFSSMQIYFIGTLAMYFLVRQTGILPEPHDGSITEDPAAWFSGLLLPWIVLALIFTANYTRMTRSSMIEQLSEDHVRTARAKGMPGRTVFLRYAWRGSLGQIITILGIDLGSLLGGAIITETTFNLHGIGRLSIDAVVDNDLPMLMAVVVVAAGLIVLFNIIVDAAYALIDPRIRLA